MKIDTYLRKHGEIIVNRSDKLSINKEIGRQTKRQIYPTSTSTRYTIMEKGIIFLSTLFFVTITNSLSNILNYITF